MNKPKDAKDKAIEYIDKIPINHRENYEIEKAIDIAISSATHDCEEKIESLKKETFLDDDSIQRAEKYKKTFPLRKFDWEYIHELEFLLDYRVDFGQKLLEDRQKLQKENTDLKQELILTIKENTELKEQLSCCKEQNLRLLNRWKKEDDKIKARLR